jgi:VanZ family protein
MKWSHALALYLFWPAFLIVAWGELTPNPGGIEVLAWDKALHFTAYAGLAGMAAVALKTPRYILWSALALMMAGGGFEILQGFTGRDPDIFDELANVLGALTGATLGWALIRLLGTKILPIQAE